jgi:hypothetical protein
LKSWGFFVLCLPGKYLIVRLPSVPTVQSKTPTSGLKRTPENPLNFFRRQNSFAYERKEERMSNVDIFVIEYKLHGQPKSFVIRAKTMRNADAWHWASCDAGIAPIPKPGKPPLKVISKPQAERFGITEVKWRETATVDWTEA